MKIRTVVYLLLFAPLRTGLKEEEVSKRGPHGVTKRQIKLPLVFLLGYGTTTANLLSSILSSHYFLRNIGG